MAKNTERLFVFFLLNRERIFAYTRIRSKGEGNKHEAGKCHFSC